MARRRRSSGKSRTISPEQQEKMQAGRREAAKQRERVEMLSELDERLRIGRMNSDNGKVHIKKRRRRYVK